VLGPLSFFPTNSLVFSRHPEQRLPCMAPAMRESDAKATFFWMPWS
jgi:peptidoglycan/xylan/chitin deacetylase (PgdA/CDA1 family)